MQTALRRKTETGNEKDPSAALGMTKRGNVSPLSFRYGSQPPPLRSTSFQGKEECCRNRAAIPRTSPSERPLAGEGGRIPFSHRHFERKREIFSVPFSHDPFAKPFRGSTASAFPRYGVSRFLLSNTLRLTANEKDPSAALGMTKRGKTSSHFFSFRCEPTSAPSGHLLQRKERIPASPIANPFPVSSSRNLPLFCGTI